MDVISKSSFSTKSFGIGLGLPVCKDIVQEQGGRIAAESQEGRGSTFTITLPAEKEPEAGA